MHRAFTRRGFGTLALGAAAAALPFASVARSAAAQDWRLASPYPQDGFPGLNTVFFAEDATRRTGGRLRLQVQAGGSYGTTGIVQAVTSGQVQLAELQLSQFGTSAPVLEADAVPYIVRDYGQAQKLWSVTRTRFFEVFTSMGLVPLYAVPWMPVGLLTRGELKSADDLSGTVAFAQDAVGARLLQTLGARTVPLEPSQVGSGFMNGTVDAVLASPLLLIGVEGPAILYDLKMSLPKVVVVVNQRVYEPEHTTTQNQLQTAADIAEQRGWATSQEQTASMVPGMHEGDILVKLPSDSLSSSFEEAGKTVAREWLARAGYQGEELLRAYRN